MKRLIARNYLARVDVARQIVILNLHIKVEVPLHEVRESFNALDWDVEVGKVRPIKGAR